MADVLSPHSSLLPPGNSFSPLTLFESTITNAQMLVESMAERELFSALKIIGNLHTHVEGDDYEADEEEEDDCIITEELNDDSLSAGFPYAKIPRLDLSADYSGAGVSGFGSSGGGGGGSGGDVPPECKTIMRRAYKMLKGNGPHLFDFSMPFSAEPNQQVAAMVMAKAKEMAEGKGWPDDVWQNLPKDSRINYLHSNFGTKIRAKYRISKLNRRQKSFELVATSLSSDELEKFRVILTRDYTSSDEECGSGGSDQLRVRELAWESDEVKRLKRQLDQVYMDNCATTKQKQQLGRCIRDPLRSRSQRPPPDGAPNWALKPPMRKN
uniref:Uncharacterized protein n=1 Tax=Macrostomum lignano TaxID=282301 RepID=A0A1I8JJF2_9PLAT